MEFLCGLDSAVIISCCFLLLVRSTILVLVSSFVLQVFCYSSSSCYCLLRWLDMVRRLLRWCLLIEPWLLFLLRDVSCLGSEYSSLTTSKMAQVLLARSVVLKRCVWTPDPCTFYVICLCCVPPTFWLKRSSKLSFRLDWTFWDLSTCY